MTNVISLQLRRFSRCNRKGHDWFPDEERREFIPVVVTCLRCTATKTMLPYGQCLGGHPMVEHYRFVPPERPRAVEGCPAPR